MIYVFIRTIHFAQEISLVTAYIITWICIYPSNPNSVFRLIMKTWNDTKSQWNLLIYKINVEKDFISLHG